MRPKLTAAGILALLVLWVANVTAADNPFVTKFGGPYLATDLSFRQRAVQYGAFWIQTFRMLGKNALKDQAGFASFVKEEVDPRLAELKPATPDEEKIKAAALFIKTAFESQVDPTKFKPEELASIEAFMKNGVPEKEEKSQANQLTYLFVRYEEFLTGLDFDQLQKQLKDK